MTAESKTEKFLLAAAIAALTVTEYFFAFMDPALGILSALISVTALYTALSLLRDIRLAIRETVDVLCLLQMYLLLISTLPWFFISQTLLIPAVYSILLALCLWHIKESSIPLKELGFKKAPLRHIASAAAIGIPLGAAEFYVLKPPPPTPTFSPLHLMQTALYMFLFVGFAEELLFRGILMTNMEKHLSPKSAQLLQALIFAVLHLTWRIPIEIFFVFIAGLIFGWLFKKNGSLIPPAVAHGVGNTVLLSVLPFLT